MATFDPTTPNDPAAVAIAVAPNGGRRGKADHPALPLTPDELAAAAAGCLEAGACMIHIHVRDKHGGHLLDADAYRAATAAIRATVGDRLVIQITSESLGVYSPAEQMEVVRQARPEAVSIALRELLPDESHETGFAQFLEWLRSERIVPQIILYTPEEAALLAALTARGLIPFVHLPVLFVLGRYAAEQRATPSDLLAFLAPGIPRFAHWSVCAFGPREPACVTAGALFGGHVRVGFENNLWLPDGSLASDNAALVAASSAALRASGLTVADADRLRRMWSAW
ncbi:3-keto-5-aminohexanoate cleavage protein [Sinorhizobium psoraleae]|uniref:3-keto-5-aminohexanoate cleavage protein n=1 Tax=Sinorhizobium psoraleae TaxID=520838 RepID=A0ABT4KPL8_9HYPH|nr:3-keto-5-aminohexanoate cleavage protein [Sinorhizobium psoraleae]MCZ4093910.1 3-keto-5-aminohexanoate cleavage protein [Sinorhizobium psoraleae]